MTKDEALNLSCQTLEDNRPTHYACEDNWYSCPKDGCANDLDGDECNCGADKANAQIDKAIAAIKEALASAQPARPSLTIQPVIEDQHGVLRFKKNELVNALYEHGVKTGFGLNELHLMEFTDEDRQQFAQLIGYSLSGYGTLAYVTDVAYEAAEQGASHDNS
jgi:hypothetical protein